jgi:RNA ligase
MSKFEKILCLDDVKSKVENMTEISFFTNTGTDYTVGCYFISCPNTFMGENKMFARETRGITFGKNGEIISRPLHKFFTVNEKEETQFDNIDWSKVVRIMNKRDGSMIHTFYTQNSKIPNAKFDVKSKRSASSGVAQLARSYILDKESYVDFCNFVTSQGATAIFEFTSPDARARIVLEYPESEMKLLHIRENVSGRYYTKEEIDSIAGKYGVPTVEDGCYDGKVIQKSDINKQFIENLVMNVEGVEGWVFQFEDGEMVKLKTKWYYDLHEVMTFVRERDVAQMVIEEKIDDVKSCMVDFGQPIDTIIEIEQRVFDDLSLIRNEAKQLAEKLLKEPSDYEAFKKYGKELTFRLAKQFNSPNFSEDKFEDNIANMFKKNYLKQKYSLNRVVI